MDIHAGPTYNYTWNEKGLISRFEVKITLFGYEATLFSPLPGIYLHGFGQRQHVEGTSSLLHPFLHPGRAKKQLVAPGSPSCFYMLPNYPCSKITKNIRSLNNYKHLQIKGLRIRREFQIYSAFYFSSHIIASIEIFHNTCHICTSNFNKPVDTSTQ